ncbi:MAG: hypothetical protein ACT4OZ_18040 [Gemmatimonadota bacterium]
MAERKPFLLRIDRDVLDAMQRWADDDLRSLNAQIEFVLRRALQQSGRRPRPSDSAAPDSEADRRPERDPARGANEPDATGS